MVADLMMVVVVQEVVQKVVWNPFFEGFCMIYFLLSYFCEGFWLLYEFCTEVLRRSLRLVVHARSFVVRVMAQWPTLCHNGSGYGDQVWSIFVQFGRDLTGP